MRHLKARLISKRGFGPTGMSLVQGRVYAVMFGADGDTSMARAVNTGSSWGRVGLHWKLQMDGIELEEQPDPIVEARRIPLEWQGEIGVHNPADDDGMHEVDDDDEIPFL